MKRTAIKKIQKNRKHVALNDEANRTAANFRRLRKMTGLNQSELALKKNPSLKNPASYISQIERGPHAGGRALSRLGREVWAELFSKLLKINIDVSEFLKPIGPVSESFESEVALLLSDIRTNCNLSQVKHLRRLFPLLVEGSGNVEKKSPGKKGNASSV